MVVQPQIVTAMRLGTVERSRIRHPLELEKA
jgi:hypothetical protein